MHYSYISIGLYGALLLADFFIQFTCAIINRVQINRLAARHRATQNISNPIPLQTGYIMEKNPAATASKVTLIQEKDAGDVSTFNISSTGSDFNGPPANLASSDFNHYPANRQPGYAGSPLLNQGGQQTMRYEVPNAKGQFPAAVRLHDNELREPKRYTPSSPNPMSTPPMSPYTDNKTDVFGTFPDTQMRRPQQQNTGLYRHQEGSEVSMAIVGYREDDVAWRKSVRTLQTQTFDPKHIIAVVDGNEGPDLAMANSFVEEFKDFHGGALMVHLPVLLSDVYKVAYKSSLEAYQLHPKTRWEKLSTWFSGKRTEAEEHALQDADGAIADLVRRWDATYNFSSAKSICISQPHGHKRTAMFTAFAIALYACNTRDAIFTTDSDTLLEPNAIDEMLLIMQSDDAIGGVTADVKIENRGESILARLCAVRYWFAFNIERGCQSLWRCVGCISGPMGLYRSCDLELILGPWIMQRFGGKDCTFGDDRHLTNQLLAYGMKTRYTHRTWCETESPTEFVRWIKQQTRWSKSFYREAFWFPTSFAYQSWWMSVEMIKQSMYPFILTATVFHLLFAAKTAAQPISWIVTLFGVAFIKAVIGAIIARDAWILTFTCYGFLYAFGLLPSKFWAIVTINQTGWGTSARSSTERKRGESIMQRSFHVIHLFFWYLGICAGLGWYFSQQFDDYRYMLITCAAFIPTFFSTYSLHSHASHQPTHALFLMVRVVSILRLSHRGSHSPLL